jgi:hypothetical protein
MPPTNRRDLRRRDASQSGCSCSSASVSGRRAALGDGGVGDHVEVERLASQFAYLSENDANDTAVHARRAAGRPRRRGLSGRTA